MGCCESKDNLKPRFGQKTNKNQLTVGSVTSDTNELSSQLECEDFLDNINALKHKYVFKKYRTLWISSCRPLTLHQEYRFQMQDKLFHFRVSSIDQEKSQGFKIVLIFPQYSRSSPESQTPNLFIFYKEDSTFVGSERTVKGTIGIENLSLNGQNEIQCDINNFMKLRINMQAKAKND